MGRQMINRFVLALVAIALILVSVGVFDRPVRAQMGNGIPAYNQCIVVTPSDTVDLPPFSQAGRLTGWIYVGGTGNLVMVGPDGSTTLFTALPVGIQLPLSMRRINATNTTATLIIACYRV